MQIWPGRLFSAILEWRSLKWKNSLSISPTQAMSSKFEHMGTGFR